MQDNKVKNGLARASNTCKDSGREEFVEKRKHMWVELGEKESAGRTSCEGISEQKNL